MPEIEYIYAQDFLDNLPNGFTSYEQPVLIYKEYRAMIRFTNKVGKVYELGNLGKNYKNKGENPNQTHIHFLKDKIIYRMNNILVGKTAVLGMRERNGKVKATVIENTESRTIKNQISKNIVQGSIVCTDEHRSYIGLKGYSHLTVNHSAKQFVDGMAHTNGIESVWALLKRGFYGTFHFFTRKHTQRYIDEFSFRLNEAKCSVKSMDRINTLIRRSIGKRLTYKELKGITA